MPNFSKNILTVSVVVPVFCNSDSLLELISRLNSVAEILSKKQTRLQVIFVDDGSLDDSLSVLKTSVELNFEKIVVELLRNYGSMIAIKAGFGRATGDCVMIMTADLQDPPELILRGAEEFRLGAKYVIFARESREDPYFSKILSWLYYRALRLLVARHFPPRGFDLFLIDSKFSMEISRCGKNSNPILYSYMLGIPSQIVKYKRLQRPYGTSKWTLRKKMKLCFDSIFGFSVVPLRLLLGFGLMFAALSFSYAIFVVFSSIWQGTKVPGFAATLGFLGVMFGVLLSLLSIVAEYLVRVLEEISTKSEYLERGEDGDFGKIQKI